MDDTELDQVISSISMELKKHDYTSRTVETEKEMQFEFNDPESGDYAELYGKKIREQKVFVFHNENPQIKLSISSSCACISIEETKYVDCLKHCDVLWKVMSIIIFTTYISELFPVFHRMSLVSMDERRMEFSIHNSNTHGVQIDSQTKKRIFKEFWKEVERSHDPKGYVAMIGMEEYPMLGIENAEEQYHAQIGMLAKYPEIPLWDYGAGIKAFMDQFIGCPIDEKSQEIIDRIINSEGGKAVIHYIAVYRKKTGDDVKEEKIETQYREFVKELIYCWADGRCTFG